MSLKAVLKHVQCFCKVSTLVCSTIVYREIIHQYVLCVCYRYLPSYYGVQTSIPYWFSDWYDQGWLANILTMEEPRAMIMTARCFHQLPILMLASNFQINQAGSDSRLKCVVCSNCHPRYVQMLTRCSHFTHKASAPAVGAAHSHPKALCVQGRFSMESTIQNSFKC